MGTIEKSEKKSLIQDDIVGNGEDKGDNKKEYNIELIKNKEDDLNDSLIEALKGVDFAGLGIELFADTFEGLNSVRDTLYVDDAPKDWKNTVNEIKGKRKEKLEHSKDIFIKDRDNKRFIVEEMGLVEKFRERYPEKTVSYIQKLAEEKAEKELEKIASSYIPLGVKNIRLMYQLSRDQEQYGYKPLEAIKQRIEFERFNKNPENIAFINQTYNIKCNTVSEVIHSAREYYNNGYTNVRDMNWLNEIANKLNKPTKYVIKIDQTLKNKKGKVNYDGEDERIKEVIEQIAKHYGE